MSITSFVDAIYNYEAACLMWTGCFVVMGYYFRMTLSAI